MATSAKRRDQKSPVVDPERLKALLQQKTDIELRTALQTNRVLHKHYVGFVGGSPEFTKLEIINTLQLVIEYMPTSIARVLRAFDPDNTLGVSMEKKKKTHKAEEKTKRPLTEDEQWCAVFKSGLNASKEDAVLRRDLWDEYLRKRNRVLIQLTLHMGRKMPWTTYPVTSHDALVGQTYQERKLERLDPDAQTITISAHVLWIIPNLCCLQVDDSETKHIPIGDRLLSFRWVDQAWRLILDDSYFGLTSGTLARRCQLVCGLQCEKGCILPPDNILSSYVALHSPTLHVLVKSSPLGQPPVPTYFAGTIVSDDAKSTHKETKEEAVRTVMVRFIDPFFGHTPIDVAFQPKADVCGQLTLVGRRKSPSCMQYTLPLLPKSSSIILHAMTDLNLALDRSNAAILKIYV